MASDPSFLDAAFSLNKGELSSLVETPQGYAIIFAADKKEPETALFEDVEQQVREDYINAKSEAMAKETAGVMLSALKEESKANFAAVAAKFNMAVKTSDYLTRNATAGSSLPPQIVNMGFELSEEKPYPEEAVSADGVFYVFRFMEKRTPASDLFTEQENAFRTGLLERKKSALLASWLNSTRS